MAIIFNIDEVLKQSAFNLLQDPFKMMFEGEVEAFERNSIINKVFTTLKLTSYQEEYRSRTKMQGFQPGADMEPAPLSDFDEGYRKVFRSVTWRNSFVVSKQAIEDNQMMQINADGMDFITGYGRTKEEFAAKMIAGALSGSATFGKYTFDCTGIDTTDGSIDGTKQVYFHKAHKTVAGAKKDDGTAVADQANKFHYACHFNEDYGLDELAEIIGMVDSKMNRFTDYNGHPVPFHPTTIILGSDYSFKSKLVAALAKKYNATVNDINASEIQVGKWRIISSPYLDGMNGFKPTECAFIMLDPAMNAKNKGFVWTDRVPLEISSRYDDDNEANVWKGRSRFSAGFGDWRCACYVNCGAKEYLSSLGNEGTTFTAFETLTVNIPTAKNVKVTNTTSDPVNTKAVAGEG